jgi:hypothetical protein
MYNQKEYFSVINKDLNFDNLNQAKEDEIQHNDETVDLVEDEATTTKKVNIKDMVKKIINDNVPHELKKPIIKKKILTRPDFDATISVEESRAAKKLKLEINDEKNKDISKSITITLYGISFALLVGLFLFFYYKKKIPSQMLH